MDNTSLINQIKELKKSRCVFSLEFGHGHTYANSRPTLYCLGAYPRSSVLYGQDRRIWVCDFGSLAEALDALEAVHKAIPRFRFDNCCGETGGSTYVSMDQIVAHIPDDTDY